MPKLERLEWIAPLSEGCGVTLSDDPAADQYLAKDPNALLLGVLYDSQYATRRAFAVPLRLRERLGHLDMPTLAEADPEVITEAFRQKPALHRFPAKFAALTQRFAQEITARYASDSSQVWMGAGSVEELGERLLQLPAFGEEKANWTVGMLGRLGVIPYGGWEEYRVTVRKRSAR